MHMIRPDSNAQNLKFPAANMTFSAKNNYLYIFSFVGQKECSLQKSYFICSHLLQDHTITVKIIILIYADLVIQLLYYHNKNK